MKKAIITEVVGKDSPFQVGEIHEYDGKWLGVHKFLTNGRKVLCFDWEATFEVIPESV